MSGSVGFRPAPDFDHRALIVEGEDTIRGRLVPHLRRAISQEETVLMVVGPQTGAIVRDRLGHDAHALRWAPVSGYYQRLGFTYSRFLRFLREHHSCRQVVQVVAEPDVVSGVDAPVDRAAAYLDYEAMTNEVYAGYGCPVTCIWDRRHQPASLIEDVRRVHPREWSPGGVADNPEYVPPAEFREQRARATVLPPVPPVTDVDLTVRHPAEVAACRAAIDRWAGRQHFVPTAVRQVVAATSEVVTNGLRHGRPPVRLRAWGQDATLIVHVDDEGGRPIPAQAGFRPPLTPADPGGLWVARQLADVLCTRTGDGRTSVRMYFPYAVTHRHLDVPT